MRSLPATELFSHRGCDHHGFSPFLTHGAYWDMNKDASYREPAAGRSINSYDTIARAATPAVSVRRMSGPIVTGTAPRAVACATSPWAPPAGARGAARDARRDASR